MSIEDKILQLKTDFDGVYEAGKYSVGEEIEIVSTITTVKQLRDMLFLNIPSNHSAIAYLSKPKNNGFSNNQVVLIASWIGYERAYRFKDETYEVVGTTANYDANVTIGDVYKVFDLGEI